MLLYLLHTFLYQISLKGAAVDTNYFSWVYPFILLLVSLSVYAKGKLLNQLYKNIPVKTIISAICIYLFFIDSYEIFRYQYLAIAVYLLFVTYHLRKIKIIKGAKINDLFKRSV